MQQRSASAVGKIIVSGEYAVVFGFPGIAVPSERTMHVTFSGSQESGPSTISWNEKNLDGKWLRAAERVAQLIHERTGVAGSFTIENHLPLGKGMGSSTALVIAMCRAALGSDCEDVARAIEDEISPGNSGLDFTVIWHEKPVLFRKGEEPTFIELPKKLLAGMELIDTGTPGEATPALVAWVRSRYESEPRVDTRSPSKKIPFDKGSTMLRAVGDQNSIHHANAIIGKCAERVLKRDPLKDILKDHHRAQVMLGVVPESVQTLIAEIEAKGGAAKVLGAGARTGGGGMVLRIR